MERRIHIDTNWTLICYVLNKRDVRVCLEYMSSKKYRNGDSIILIGNGKKFRYSGNYTEVNKCWDVLFGSELSDILRLGFEKGISEEIVQNAGNLIKDARGRNSFRVSMRRIFGSHKKRIDKFIVKTWCLSSLREVIRDILKEESSIYNNKEEK